jgi:hypothetical protein
MLHEELLHWWQYCTHFLHDLPANIYKVAQSSQFSIDLDMWHNFFIALTESYSSGVLTTHIHMCMHMHATHTSPPVPLDMHIHTHKIHFNHIRSLPLFYCHTLCSCATLSLIMHNCSSNSHTFIISTLLNGSMNNNHLCQVAGYFLHWLMTSVTLVVHTCIIIGKWSTISKSRLTLTLTGNRFCNIKNPGSQNQKREVSHIFQYDSVDNTPTYLLKEYGIQYKYSDAEVLLPWIRYTSFLPRAIMTKNFALHFWTTVSHLFKTPMHIVTITEDFPSLIVGLLHPSLSIWNNSTHYISFCKILGTNDRFNDQTRSKGHLRVFTI